MNKKVLGIVLVLAASFAVASVAPAFACNFNEPEDVVINYWTGGYGTVVTPSGWPTGGLQFGGLMIYAQHVEAGSLGTGDTISLSIKF